MKKTVSLLAAVILCLVCCVSYAEESRIEGPGFATPEEALMCYMEGLRDQDFEKMLSAFAWETQLERMSFDQFFNMRMFYSPGTMPRIPLNDNGFIFSANVNALRYSQVELIYFALEKFLLGEESPDGMTIQFKSEEDITAFTGKFDSSRLEKLAGMDIQISGVDSFPGSVKYTPESFEKSVERNAGYYNADELAYLVGSADLGDETLYCVPTIARYGEKWYLVSLSSVPLSIQGIQYYETAFLCRSKAE